jgi:hypothetical protein
LLKSLFATVSRNVDRAALSAAIDNIRARILPFERGSSVAQRNFESVDLGQIDRLAVMHHGCGIRNAKKAVFFRNREGAHAMPDFSGSFSWPAWRRGPVDQWATCSGDH